MPHRNSCYSLLVPAATLFLLCGAIPAAAKDKPQPVPQWATDAAKAPTPADAGDASSVILFDEYVETIDAGGRAVEREREAIRILKPQGRGTSCRVSYGDDEKINYFREWTITASGQTFQARDTDFVDRGGGEEGVVRDIPILLLSEKSRIVKPPAADVGATILCESEELLAPWNHEKIWNIQTGIPFVYQSLEIDLPPSVHFGEAWHGYQPVKPVEVAPNHWRWEIKDMPRLDLRDISAHPSWDALVARMSVYWGNGASAGKDAQWLALGQWTTDLEAHRTDPTPEITARAQQLTAGAKDFYGKLQAITDSIQKNIRYFIVVRGIGGMQAHYAADIYRNRYGDCKDKTTLLISMLQAVGIQAYYMPVDSHRGVVDPDAPSTYGNHMITAIEIPADVSDARLMAVSRAKDGKRYLIFDPTDERTPVGNLPSNEQGGYGLLAAGPSSQVLALPVLDPAANGTVETGKFTLAADGTLAGSIDATHTGPEGAEYRSFLKYSDDKERHDAWEKMVARSLPGVVLDSFQFVEPAALDRPLEFHYKVTKSQYAHAAGPLLLVRPRVIGSVATHIEDKPRKVPIDLDATGRWQASFDIALPAGYAVDELPNPVHIDMDFASYRAASTVKDNVLHYEREYVVRQVVIPAERVSDFRKLQSAIAEDEQASAVLKKQ
jgi:hypothetical protein